MRRSRSTAALWLTVLGLSTSNVLGQATPDATAEARARFQAGLAAAQEGDLITALSAFEAAYAIQPHYSVLYNIGRARAGLGKYREAIVAFQLYLDQGSSRLDAARREEVGSLIQTSRLRLGRLRLLLPHPETTRVWLDGKELSRADLNEPIELSVGSHSLLFSILGAAPIAKTAEIRSSSVTEATLEVTSGSTLLSVRCAVPDVQIFLDESPRGRTPLSTPLRVETGRHQVRFFRQGYRTVVQRLDFERGQPMVADCEQRVLSPVAREDAASLSLRLEPRDARAQVDGVPFDGRPLPSGAHELTVARDGFLPFAKRIVLSQGRTTEYSVVLQPTQATIVQQGVGIRRRHNIAYALAGTGAVLLAASASLYIWNGNRYDDWRMSDQRPLGRAVSIQRFDDLALGLLLAGAGAATGGAALYLSAPPAPR